ncbi:MAG: hypothetical protein R3A48_05525 [Polyangiales bacterium]
MARPRSQTVRLAAMLCALGACKRTPPPVPFRSSVPPVDAALVDAGDDLDDDVPDAGAVFRVRSGEAVDGDGRSLRFGAHPVPAPAGERFAQRITWDYDRDGTLESLFVARVRDDGDAAGVSLVRPAGDTPALGAVEGPEPEDRSCGAPAFRQTSPRSLVLDWRCPDAAPERDDGGPRGAFRAESVLMGPIGEELGFRARAGILRQPLPDTELGLSIEGVDTNGDGVDELVCHVSAGRPGAAPGARAKVVFFQRESGFVWDTAEPAASIQAVIARHRRRAASRRTAPAAIQAMEDLLRLRRALCNDSGLARFKLAGAVGIRCRADLLDGAAEVVLRAQVALGELPAAWAMTRPETAHPLGVVPFARVRSLLEGASAPARGVTVSVGPDRPLGVDRVPLMHVPAARWESPSDPQGIVLLGERAQRVSRADWSTREAPDLALDGAAALIPTDLGRTQRLMGLGWTRRGLEAVFCPVATGECAAAWTVRPGSIPAGASASAMDFAPPADVPLEGDSANYAQAYAGDDAHVLAWGPEGVVLAVRGTVWRVGPSGATRLRAGAAWGGTYPAGQSITEDGSVVTLPTPEGLWIYESRAWHRLAPEALRPRMPLCRDANPSADGRAILLRFEDGRLAVVQRPAPSRR